MRVVLLILLLASPAQASTVEELFARSRAAVERANGIAFDFEYRGETLLRGSGAVRPDGSMLVETPDVTVWSDGELVEVHERKSKTIWHTAMHRGGGLLIETHLHGVTDAFASPTRFETTLVYKPKLDAPNVVTIASPGGGWRWHFDPADSLLRRQEVTQNGKTETIEYSNVRRLASPIRRPRPAGFTRKAFSLGGPEPGDTPRFSIKTLDGATISSDSLRGRVTVVDFWATWCGPCRPSMQALQALHERHRDLAVLGLRWRDSGDAAAFAKKHGITYPLGDAGDAAATFKVDKFGIPLLFVIGRDGRVVDYVAGYNGPATERWLEKAIAKARKQ